MAANEGMLKCLRSEKRKWMGIGCFGELLSYLNGIYGSWIILCLAEWEILYLIGLFLLLLSL